ARVRDAQVPHDARRRSWEPGRARSVERGGRAPLQDPRGPARDLGRGDSPPLLAGRDPAGLERAPGPDEPRRAETAAAARLPAARGLAPQALPRSPAPDRALADLRPFRSQLRRPRAAR